MALSDAKLKQMNELRIAYAKDRINQCMKDLDQAIDDPEDLAMIKAVSKMIADGYAQGYRDCYENEQVRMLIF